MKLKQTEEQHNKTTFAIQYGCCQAAKAILGRASRPGALRVQNLRCTQATMPNHRADRIPVLAQLRSVLQ